MSEVREERALLLAWEIGKPRKLACADVDRALDGVRWYVDEIEPILATDARGRDNEQWAHALATQLQAFKVGVNEPRSRGDKCEPFGGWGGSWRGVFVGGEHLVYAVTLGPDDEQLDGNFPDYSRYPVPGSAATRLEVGGVR